jgi:hypothetical protein
MCSTTLSSVTEKDIAMRIATKRSRGPDMNQAWAFVLFLSLSTTQGLAVVSLAKTIAAAAG